MGIGPLMIAGALLVIGGGLCLVGSLAPGPAAAGV